MQTGENEQALRKILDMTRLIAITLLFLHFYYQLYTAFSYWGFVSSFTDRLLGNIVRTGLYSNFYKAKLIALGFLVISLIGVRGRKDEKQNYKSAAAYIISGLLLYFISYLVLLLSARPDTLAILYMSITGVGFMLVLSGGTVLSRIIKDNLDNDIFNADNETFPQEERLIENEFSINLPTEYRLKDKPRRGYINIISGARGLIVSGNPGSGKSAFVINELIRQALSKPVPYTMLVYDFKFPDLSLIAYNYWLRNKHKYKGSPEFIVINFDDLERSHRGNVFNALGMKDITDAAESARTILYGLNPEWKKKQGDFFSESAINFVTAIIWFLRKYQDGAYCTLPHVMEFMMLEYDKLFTLLRLEPEVDAYVGDFIKAYLDDVMEQLSGQIASAKVAMARLSSPQLYYVLSGDEFTLDINNPEHPKVMCLGNNPQKIQTYGAVLSLYINRLLKIINQKNKEKCFLVFDEYDTITLDIIPTIATGRSNLINTCLGLQSLSQLKKSYGKEQADVISDTIGNVISGQVFGEHAKQLSELIGKINQEQQSLSINSQDTSVSKSKRLEYAVPSSRIAKLSSGEFVGIVADTPDQPIENKAFHGKILTDFEAIKKDEKSFKPIPIIHQVTKEMVQRNFMRIKQEVQNIVRSELERLAETPALQHLLIKKR